VLGAAVVVAAGAAVAAFAGTRPDPAAQAQKDGCGRSASGLFQKLQPTWVYVGDAGSPADGPAPPPQWARGLVSANPAWLGAHPTDVDDPVSHDSFDFLVNVKPDAPYAFLMGTGNFAGGDDSEEVGRLHTEWEQAAFAPFAWPAAGDTVQLLGNWVWDCGHWLPGGERTELHPLRAVWVDRQGLSPRSLAGETEGDLFISTAATPAGASADCAHRTKGDQAAFKACLNSAPDWQDVNGTYRFTLAAPAKPSPGARLRVRVVDAGSVSAPAVHAVPGPGGVVVTLAISAPAGQRVVVAKKIFAGWTTAPKPVHVRVTFERILVRRAMDPGGGLESTRTGQISKPPGEWVLYDGVAGVWAQWPLLRPVDGQTIRLNRPVDVYLGARQPWRLIVTGRECDNGSLSAHSITAPPSPCPAGTGEFLDLAGDDSPGVVTAAYRSPSAAVGEHSVNATTDGSSCPRANVHGCYQVVFRIAVRP
jgi:hypothetical protein